MTMTTQTATITHHPRPMLPALLALAALLWASGAHAGAPRTPPASLYTCQVMVRAQTNVFALLEATDVGVCLQTYAAQLILKNRTGAYNSPTQAATLAAPTCAALFRRLHDTRGIGASVPEVLSNLVTRYCEPGGSLVTHALSDVIGLGPWTVPEQLNAKNLGSWCANFGGDGAISTVGDWISCLQNVATDTAVKNVAAQFPRALEWLALIKPAIQALPVTAKLLLVDPNRYTEAVAGLDQVVAAMTPLLATRFVDNGDGTISDNSTGLMWEKKDQSGGIHDWSNRYSWSSGGTAADGTAFTTFLATLNTPPCFAGHCDWRLPTSEFPPELQSILASPWPCTFHCVPPIFNTGCVPGCNATSCSCTQSYRHWSATANNANPNFAWDVDFYDGGVRNSDKTWNYPFVRAVRRGL